MKLEAILNRWKKRSTLQRSGNLGGSRQRKQDGGQVPPTNNGGTEVARAMQEESSGSQNLSEHSSIDSDDAIIDAPGLVAASLNRQTPKQIMMSNIRRHAMIRRRRPLALIREINLSIDTEDAIIEDAIPSPDTDARSSSQEDVVVSPNEKSEYDDRSTLQLIRQVAFLRVNTAATTATNPASSPSISSQCDSPSLRALWNSKNNLHTQSRSSSSRRQDMKPQNLAGPTTNAETGADRTSPNENSGADHNRTDDMDEEERTSAHYFFPRLRRRRRRPSTPHKEHPLVVDPSSSGESTISPAHHNRTDDFLVVNSLE